MTHKNSHFDLAYIVGSKNGIGGIMVSLECGRSWVQALVRQTKDDKVGICCFSVKHAALTLGNRKCKYARFFPNITGKMQIIKDYQLY